MNLYVHSQIVDSIEWHKKGEYTIGKDDIWAIDGMDNVLITKNKGINKFDSTGVLKFSQSIKSYGRLLEILPINTMKILIFSEEQQSICLLDNTLTLSEECIDLSIFNIGNASHISVSGQPDKIWVLDELNSKLVLLSLGGTNQFQEIKNLKGILNMADVTFIKEVNNELFVADSKGKIYQFDLYGSLIGVHDNSNFQSLAIKESSLILLDNNSLIIQNMKLSDKKILMLPVHGITDFKLSGDYFYFRCENKIFKYGLTLQN